MSSLPDINTSGVSFLAYFNAIDQGGAGSISPSEVTTSGRVQNYTLYDNGLSGEFNARNGRTITFRVKTDGWFVAYLDRGDNFARNLKNDVPRGSWDIFNDWTYTNSADDFTRNELERCINDLVSELSNSGSVTYNPVDVGLYDYRHPSASVATGLSDYLYMKTQGTNEQTKTVDFQYTDDTNLLYAVATGYAISHYNDFYNTYGNGRTEFNGIVMSEHEYDGGEGGGAIDLLSRGEIPSAGTQYGHLFYAKSSTNNRGGGSGKGNILVIWN